jgi:hypothetical protein
VGASDQSGEHLLGLTARGRKPPNCLAGACFRSPAPSGTVLRKKDASAKGLTMHPAGVAALGVLVRCLAALLGATLFVMIATTPAVAQQGDHNAIFRRLSELHAAGNYPAALVEAQKHEAAVKARFGVNHPNYAAALNSLAVVYVSLGKYADAEGLYKRAGDRREHAHPARSGVNPRQPGRRISIPRQIRRCRRAPEARAGNR